MADDDQQRDTIADDGGKLVGRVANSLVMSNGNSPVPSAVLQPLIVGTIGRKQISVAFHRQSGLGEDLRKLLAEVAIGEIGAAHAARS